MIASRSVNAKGLNCGRLHSHPGHSSYHVPMSLTVEIRDPATGFWHHPPEGPLHLGERARLRVSITAPTPLTATRLYAGDVLVASSLWEDQAEYHLRAQAYPPGTWVGV